MKKHAIIWTIVLIFSLANLLLAAYIQQQKVLNDKKLIADPLNCFVDLSEGEHGCATVQTSVYATTFGIPNPIYGIVFYSLMILFSVYYLTKPKLSEVKQTAYMLLMLGGVTAGALFSIWLLYVQFFLIHATCVYCLWVDALMILMALLLWFNQDVLEVTA